jgi:hypothetical protein
LIVLVCGGRVGRNLSRVRVWAVMEEWARQHLGEELTVVAGGARYVDTWAVEWAWHRGHKVIEVKIDSEIDGHLSDAPFRRNERMHRETRPDVCLGFPGGGGTNHMMKFSHDAGTPVVDVEIEEDGAFRLIWWPAKTKEKR